MGTLLEGEVLANRMELTDDDKKDHKVGKKKLPIEFVSRRIPKMILPGEAVAM